MVPRIGFCCKWKQPPGIFTPKETKVIEERMNQKSTTVASFTKLTQEQQYEKIQTLVQHNLDALNSQLAWVANQPPEMRMMRIASDFLPLYTHECSKEVYGCQTLMGIIFSRLARLGQFARKNEIRLSMHPGQYTIFNSLKEDTVHRAIEDFEYHTMIMRAMGYGSTWHSYGAVINIHAGSRAGGLEQTIQVINKRLSPEARNLITLENDEFSYGLDDLLAAKDHVAIVLDIHHHLINTGGEYIQANDKRIDLVKESWRGIRPLGHFSTSRRDVCSAYINQLIPVKTMLETEIVNKTDLRAHSDDCWNDSVNEWAISHLEWTDLEVEAKDKNLASQQLYEAFKG